MPSAARKGDIGAAHGCFPSSPAIEGSGDVFINGKPAVRVGDAYAAHGCGKCAPHGRNAAQGSATVNINGRPAVRIGDSIHCGGNAQTGSPNVFIGDETWTGLPFDPPQPVLRLFLTQTPGNQNHPYTFEPYKLYKDGGMVQQGWTDEKGLIEYAYDPPWTYVLKVETEVGTFTFQPTPMHPVDTETGMQQRLDMLGFYPQPKHGNATNPGGKLHYEQAQTVLDGNVSGKLDAFFIQIMKPVMP